MLSGLNQNEAAVNEFVTVQQAGLAGIEKQVEADGRARQEAVQQDRQALEFLMTAQVYIYTSKMTLENLVTAQVYIYTSKMTLENLVTAQVSSLISCMGVRTLCLLYTIVSLSVPVWLRIRIVHTLHIDIYYMYTHTHTHTHEMTAAC